MSEKKPLENPGTSMVFYSLVRSPANRCTASVVKGSLGLRNWSSAKEQLHRLEEAGFVTSNKPTGEKARNYKIDWKRVTGYALDTSILEPFAAWRKSKGDASRAAEARRLTLGLRQSRMYQRLIQSFLTTYASDVTDVARAKRGKGVLNPLPEYTVGAVLRRMQAEIATYIPMIERPAAPRELRQLYENLSTFVRFYDEVRRRLSLSAAMIASLEDMKFHTNLEGLPRKEEQLISLELGKVLR